MPCEPFQSGNSAVLLLHVAVVLDRGPSRTSQEFQPKICQFHTVKRNKNGSAGTQKSFCASHAQFSHIAVIILEKRKETSRFGLVARSFARPSNQARRSTEAKASFHLAVSFVRPRSHPHYVAEHSAVAWDPQQLS